MAKQMSIPMTLRQLDRAIAIIAAIKLVHDEGSHNIDLADLAHVAQELVQTVRDELDWLETYRPWKDVSKSTRTC